MNEKPKTQKPASVSLIITGGVLITIWLFASRPWENGEEIPYLIFIDTIVEAFLLLILLFGIYLFVLGLVRLLHAKRDKKL